MPTSTATYEIVDGVRRARAWFEEGATTIEAIVTGNHGATITLSIDTLRSPHKSVIDTATSSRLQRWQSIKKAIATRRQLPPILVRLGSRGIPVSQILVV